MKKKSIIGMTLVIALVVTASAAFADGRGYGRGGYGMMGPGMGYGYGPGSGMGYGPGAMWGGSGAVDAETSKTLQKLYQKRAELDAVLSAPQVDGRKAKSLQMEINNLQNELSEKRLAAELEFRKNNPGASSGWGAGYGPGACWR